MAQLVSPVESASLGSLAGPAFRLLAKAAALAALEALAALAVLAATAASLALAELEASVAPEDSEEEHPVGPEDSAAWAVPEAEVGVEAAEAPAAWEVPEAVDRYPGARADKAARAAREEMAAKEDKVDLAAPAAKAEMAAAAGRGFKSPQRNCLRQVEEEARRPRMLKRQMGPPSADPTGQPVQTTPLSVPRALMALAGRPVQRVGPAPWAVPAPMAVSSEEPVGPADLAALADPEVPANSVNSAIMADPVATALAAVGR